MKKLNKPQAVKVKDSTFSYLTLVDEVHNITKMSFNRKLKNIQLPSLKKTDVQVEESTFE